MNAAGLFDLTDEYTQMLDQGIRLSGEDQYFFIRGRLRHLRQRLPPNWRPRRILDFGCGIGHTAWHLGEAFPDAEVVGFDTSSNALAQAQAAYRSPRIQFHPAEALPMQEPFDLCYTNGVFHHISPGERPRALRMIYDSLAPGGYFALFENNPWNPGTRCVMRRIPFDRDAITLSPPTGRQLVESAGFRLCGATRFLFYFPCALALLRFSEPWLSRAPLGAQYCVLASRLARVPGAPAT
ncbi:MAG TPA: class I SAM-dependent methyltransferase [Bryobacterales bacterium]|nr:class I SAM-dependent methyltransferase [Bryobacterales bacterium]